MILFKKEDSKYDWNRGGYRKYMIKEKKKDDEKRLDGGWREFIKVKKMNIKIRKE